MSVPVRSEAPGFLSGVRAFFRGFRLVVQPGALAFAAVPALVGLALFFGFSLLFSTLVPDFLLKLTGAEGWVATVVNVLGTILAVVLSAFVALLLAQPASGPALEALVRATERHLGLPERPPTPFLTDVLRSAGSAGLGLLFGFIAFAVLLLLSLIPGAVVVTVPLKFVAAAFCVAWEVCDYPLSVKGLSVGDRIAYLGRHKRPVFGFAAGVALIALIPCGFLLVLPMGVAGATSLIAEIERHEGRV